MTTETDLEKLESRLAEAAKMRAEWHAGCFKANDALRAVLAVTKRRWPESATIGQMAEEISALVIGALGKDGVK